MAVQTAGTERQCIPIQNVSLGSGLRRDGHDVRLQAFHELVAVASIWELLQFQFAIDFILEETSEDVERDTTHLVEERRGLGRWPVQGLELACLEDLVLAFEDQLEQIPRPVAQLGQRHILA